MIKSVAIWNKSEGKCFYCGIELVEKSMQNDEYCVDHFVPRNSGGDSEIDNLFPCCRKCNSVKNKIINVQRFRDIVAFRAANMPTFSEEQMNYLRSINTVFPDVFTNYKFWFELNTNYRIDCSDKAPKIIITNL
jgi:5-methylcytosine-specific restriction endonuclease McrA